MKKILLIVSVLLFSLTSSATHVLGADITYKAISNKKFEVTLRIYRDCRGIPLTNPANFYVQCTTPGSTPRNISYNKVSIRDVTPRCNAAVNKVCNPENTMISTGEYPIEEHVYKGTIDFNVTPLSTDLANGCCEFRIIYDECCRNSAINTGTPGNFFVASTVNVCLAPQNSSPQFSVDLFVYALCNSPFFYNAGAIDTIDNDSLAYRLVRPDESAGTYFSYGSSYSLNKPLTPYLPGSPSQVSPTANPPIGFYLDSVRGDLIFTPVGCSEVGPVAFAISEFRRDSSETYRKIGEVRRDIQFIVRNGAANNPPSYNAPGGYNYSVCENSQLCFNINASDQQFVPPPPMSVPAPDSLFITWNGALSGATLTVDSFTKITGTTGPKFSNRSARFCWTPPVGAARSMPYQVVITVEDKFCTPQPVRHSRTFQIRVKKVTTANRYYEVKDCAKLIVKSDTNNRIRSWTWYVRDSAGNFLSTAQVNKTNSNKMIDSFLFKKPGHYIIQLSASNSPENCPDLTYDTVYINTGFHALINAGKGDTTLCTGQGMTAHANIIGAKGAVKYKWFWDLSNPGNDSTSSYTVAKAPGKLELRVTDSTGCQMGGTLVVKNSQTFNLGPDLKQCAGDTSTLVGPPNMSSYVWLPDSVTSRVFKISTPGFFALHTIDSFGCSAADSIRIDTLPYPKKKFKGTDTSFCLGDSLYLSAEGGHTSYTWSNGFIGRTIVILKAGQYFVDINGSGCITRDSILVHTDSVPGFSFTSFQSAAKRFDFSPSVISPDYKYYWTFGDGDTSHTASPVHQYNSAGTFNVCLSITNDMGCTRTSCQNITLIGLKELPSKMPVLIYPNPFSDRLELSMNLLTASELSFELYDIPGKLLYSATELANEGQHNSVLDFSGLNLPEAVYTLKIIVNGIPLYYQVVKKN